MVDPRLQVPGVSETRGTVGQKWGDGGGVQEGEVREGTGAVAFTLSAEVAQSSEHTRTQRYSLKPGFEKDRSGPSVRRGWAAGQEAGGPVRSLNHLGRG